MAHGPHYKFKLDFLGSSHQTFLLIKVYSVRFDHKASQWNCLPFRPSLPGTFKVIMRGIADYKKYKGGYFRILLKTFGVKLDSKEEFV